MAVDEQYAQALRDVARLERENALLLAGLEWIARVNAMDYEYQRKARETLAGVAGPDHQTK